MEQIAKDEAGGEVVCRRQDDVDLDEGCDGAPLRSVKVGDSLRALVKGRWKNRSSSPTARPRMDANPIHTTTEFAQQSGYKSVFAQGMLSMGFLGQLLVRELRRRPMKRFKVRFAKITWPERRSSARASSPGSTRRRPHLVDCDVQHRDRNRGAPRRGQRDAHPGVKSCRSDVDPQFVGLESPRWPFRGVGKRFRSLVSGSPTHTSTFTGIFADLYEEPAALLPRSAARLRLLPGSVGELPDASPLHQSRREHAALARVRRGDRIGLATRTASRWRFVEFFARRRSARCRCINYMLRAEEIDQLTADAGCSVLFVDRAVLERDIKDQRRVPQVDTWILVSSRKLRAFTTSPRK